MRFRVLSIATDLSPFHHLHTRLRPIHRGWAGIEVESRVTAR